MKINNKIALVMIGSILLIANAIPIGRYLSEKQTTNDVIKATTISSAKISNISNGQSQNAQILPTNKLSKTWTPSTSFTEIGPSTNLKIKVTGAGTFVGISRMSYFLKYQTWEKKLIIQSNGTTMTMWNAVDHEVTVGGNDSKIIEVAGTKIADTKVRIKSSQKGWAKMAANKDLKWPKGLNPTVANTTFSIDSMGSEFNPSVSFYYHIKGYDKLKVASYDVFSFSQWLKNHLFDVIMGIVALCIVIVSIIAIAGTLGMTTSVVAAGDAFIVGEIAMTQIAATAADALAAGATEETAVALAWAANTWYDGNCVAAMLGLFGWSL